MVPAFRRAQGDIENVYKGVNKNNLKHNRVFRTSRVSLYQFLEVPITYFRGFPAVKPGIGLQSIRCVDHTAGADYLYTARGAFRHERLRTHPPT